MSRVVEIPFSLLSDFGANSLAISLSAGEDSFELHSVQLEAVEKQIRELLGSRPS